MSTYNPTPLNASSGSNVSTPINVTGSAFITDANSVPIVYEDEFASGNVSVSANSQINSASAHAYPPGVPASANGRCGSDGSTNRAAITGLTLQPNLN